MSGRRPPITPEHYEIRRAFRVTEVALLLGMSRRAVLDLIHAGRLAATRPTVNGGYYTVPKSEVERLENSARRRST